MWFAYLSHSPLSQKPRTTKECLGELMNLKDLLDAGLLTLAEFQDLKAKLLRGV